MRVEREHAWPNPSHDALRLADMLSPLLPAGFYYRLFRQSPHLFGAFERLLAHAAGQGRLPSAHSAREFTSSRLEEREIDVLVVGGGVSGMSAALSAANDEAHVLLVESTDRLGGRLADDERELAVVGIANNAAMAGPVFAAHLAALVARQAGIETMINAQVIGWYEEGVLAIDRHPDLLLVKPSAVVLATGAYERGLPFPNCDLPGVMTLSGIQRLISRYGVVPGARAVLVTSTDHAYGVLPQLLAHGIEVLCVADIRRSEEIGQSAMLEQTSKSVETVTDVETVVAHGIGRVRALSVRGVGGAGRTERRYPCDLVCFSNGARPADDLAFQAHCEGSIVLGVPKERLRVQEGTECGMPWPVGLANGVDTVASAIAQGGAAGSAACARALS
jgi:sarcosine oxidase subunit alpha